jgi:hypothetical protein
MEPMDDFTFGTVMGTLRAIRDANDTAADWKRYAHEVEANRDQWISQAKKLEAEAKDLADKLAIERAHAEGLRAVVDAFKYNHPDSPLLEQLGAFRSAGVEGQPKRRYHLHYENAFDAEAKKNGISNPAMRRFN